MEVTENVRLYNFRTEWDLLNIILINLPPLQILKLSLLKPKENDLLKVIQQFAPKSLTALSIVTYCAIQLPSHFENLFLVAEVLEEHTNSYCKYKLKYFISIYIKSFIKSFILIALFPAIHNTGILELEGNLEIIYSTFKR